MTTPVQKNVKNQTSEDKILAAISNLQKTFSNDLNSISCNLLDTEERLCRNISATEDRIRKTLESRFKQMDSKIEKVENKVTTLESDFKLNSERLMELHIKSNKYNLMIFNFDETENSNDQLRANVIHLCNETLKIPVGDKDIDDLFRIGKKIENKDRPIVVTLY